MLASLSRHVDGKNKKSIYGNWYYPLYPENILDFVPTLKLNGKQTSVILSEFWAVMSFLVRKDTPEAFNSFKATIDSIPSNKQLCVKFLEPDGKLTKQMKEIDQKTTLMPLYFFLKDMHLHTSSGFPVKASIHNFVQEAVSKNSQPGPDSSNHPYAEVIYNKVCEIIQLNQLKINQDSKLTDLSNVKIWEIICHKSNENDSDISDASSTTSHEEQAAPDKKTTAPKQQSNTQKKHHSASPCALWSSPLKRKSPPPEEPLDEHVTLRRHQKTPRKGPAQGPA